MTVHDEGAGGALVGEPEVVTRGDVSIEWVGYAKNRLLTLIDVLDEPLLLARVTLTMEPDPARERPAKAKVTLDVAGDLVRVEVAAHAMDEAIDRARDRLRDKLQHRSERRRARRRTTAETEPGEWRRGNLPTERPEYFDRPREDREVVRQKTLAPGELTPEEAVFDMELLDHEFFLFTELGSGVDAVVERDGDGGYTMTRLRAAVGAGTPGEPIALVGRTAPELTLREAIERLDVGGERFVFYTDPETGRGTVLYRRYDGHYGLVAAA